VDNLTAREKKCLLLIQQIQEMHKQGLGIAEIARRTGKDIGTVKKYREGEPIILCRHGRRGKSKLDPFRDIIIEKLKAKIHQADIIRHITENGTEFSGGEVQKLLLARAVYKESPILILDEPTAAMDPIAEQNIYLQYNELSKNKTAFFISHRLSSTRFCDRIILIDGGKIREAGTHDELMDKGGLYHDMYMIQSRYYQEGVQAI